MLVVPFQPVPITVYPDPQLHVKYFHQRDVFSDDPFTSLIEPSIPFSLAVMIQNTGHGAAKDVKITSAQPQIIDNQKGLLINFTIIGTQVAGQNVTPSLTVDFGTINPGQIAIGQWLLTSTLQGLFTDYSATLEHTGGPLDQQLPIIDEVSIHEMIHLVEAPGAFEDGKPDFLVSESRLPPFDLPDTLYFSDGSTDQVQVVQDSTIVGLLSANNLILPAGSLPTATGATTISIPVSAQHQIASKTDADDYLARLSAFGSVLDQERDVAEHDIALGIVPPDFVLSRTLEQMTKLRGTPATKSPLVAACERVASFKRCGCPSIES